MTLILAASVFALLAAAPDIEAAVSTSTLTRIEEIGNSLEDLYFLKHLLHLVLWRQNVDHCWGTQAVSGAFSTSLTNSTFSKDTD